MSVFLLLFSPLIYVFLLGFCQSFSLFNIYHNFWVINITPSHLVYFLSVPPSAVIHFFLLFPSITISSAHFSSLFLSAPPASYFLHPVFSIFHSLLLPSHHLLFPPFLFFLFSLPSESRSHSLSFLSSFSFSSLCTFTPSSLSFFSYHSSLFSFFLFLLPTPFSSYLPTP